MKIGVVIVTYNRVEQLKKTLELFELQSEFPNTIIVVNNASTDSTAEFLNEWSNKGSKHYKRVVYTSEVNEGGSGGFYHGLDIAINTDCDWIWVSDDDAFPDKDAIKIAHEFLKDHSNEKISAICGKVINNDRIDFEHRRIIKHSLLTIQEITPEDNYSKDYFEINLFSYVGTIISKAALKEAGLTNKDYFIWRDDTEHSLRLSKVGKIYCVPSIEIHHNVRLDNDSISWKNYYGYRNKTVMYKLHFPRRCYYYYLLKMTIEIIKLRFIDKNYVLADMCKEALRDAKTGKLGLHEKYRPGWHIIE